MAITERQLKLYNYLLNRNGWANRIDILNDLKAEYDFVDNGNLYRNSAAKGLTQDIRALNNNPDIRKLVIYNSKLGIKIADQQEALEFMQRNYISNMKRLQKHYRLQEKLNKHGQYAFIGDGTIKEMQAFKR